jgi:amidophosphoribosyltransferase
LEDQPVDESCIVVSVPDTAKAAADAFAYRMGLRSVEGLLRNRYTGRTFIQPDTARSKAAKGKYTPLPGVLKGKRVFLIEDSIVRATTLRALVDRIRRQGKAREIHVRVACPPIVAPCFYGIDMTRLGELFAPKFIPRNYSGQASEKMLVRMARDLAVDSLRYLSVPDLGGCLGMPNRSLCTGCVMGKYPTTWGNRLVARCHRDHQRSKTARTYE